MLKNLGLGTLLVASVVFAFAANNNHQHEGGCCGSKAKAATVASTAPAKAQGGECCKSKAAAVATTAPAKAEGGACCKSKAAAVATTAPAKAEGGACCKSTAAKPIAKGAKGCCNEVGALAKFKVFADGKWMFYGCRGSAEKGRRELLTMAFRVGQVQPVTGQVRIPRNQSLL